MSGATAAGGTETGEARDPRLDGLRGLAILLVMLYHTTHYGLARSRLEEALGVLPSVGWSGVDLFFVLSGFLITGILLRSKASSSYYSAFYARRVLRIFPIYYAMLVWFLLIVPRIDFFSLFNDFWYPGAPREGFWFWLYLSNVPPALTGAWTHQALSITWSLAIEEHFYLIWPFVVRHVDDRRLLAICAFTAAGALALRSALVVAGAPALAAYTLTPCRLDGLAAGAALAIVAYRRGGLASLAGPARVALPAALVAFAAVQAWVRLQAPPAEGYVARTTQLLALNAHPLMQTLGFSLLCVVYGALLVRVATARPGSPWARAFEIRWLRSFGKYSYSMYLFHFFVGLMVVQVFPPGARPERYLVVQGVFWALAIGTTWGLAWLSWQVLEEPLLRLKRRFPYRV
jgi:peptidoglycan/LPS O-acetylase OafA/YrhL